MAETAFDWDDLRYFLAVARAGRLTLAAKRLGQEHTTVSRRLRALETALHCQLFLRSPQGYQLTEAGQRLLATAQAVESATLAAQAETAGPDGLAGSVRIGTPDGFGAHFLAPRIKELSLQNSSLNIELITMPHLLSLSKREADIAIGLSRPKTGRVFARRLTDYHLQLYGARDYLARHAPISAPEQIPGHPLVGYVDDYLYTPELDYLHLVGPGLKPRLRASNLLAQMRMTLAGAGLCVLPCFMAAGEPELVPVLPESIRLTRTYWMITHADQRELPRIRACGDFIADLVRHERGLFLLDG
ncbi:LysR family transcriptional regulator [Ferrovibrio sp.]|uniref:LysR family transcriptional regulator n=1 Tax=Ferrovibrio sp. TaxID=1917215 RepID=UPI0025C32E9E|nr:LysR family transcriptional regulator [Ferrovibrio sp.]MBX3453973.1 LysR family transcriptional regulator [Ferrovibrio sp.]